MNELFKDKENWLLSTQVDVNFHHQDVVCIDYNSFLQTDIYSRYYLRSISFHILQARCGYVDFFLQIFLMRCTKLLLQYTTTGKIKLAACSLPEKMRIQTNTVCPAHATNGTASRCVSVARRFTN